MANFLASAVTGLGGAAATGNAFWSSLGNIMKLDGMLGGGQQQGLQPGQMPQMNPQQNMPQAPQQAPAQTNVSGNIAKETEWEKMAKLLAAQKQNDFSSWLSR